MLFGAAWHGRRVALIEDLGDPRRILDVGAGEARLVADAERRMLVATGVEPSAAMRRAGLVRSASLLAGSAMDLPLPSGACEACVISYPGRWIFNPQTWLELGRVLEPDGRVVVLLGGTYERGPGAAVRRRLLRLAYGPVDTAAIVKSDVCGPRFRAEIIRRQDCWGEYVLLRAERAG